ncbi:hypothetical protein ISCGN_015589 [Ixodes scapularis]
MAVGKLYLVPAFQSPWSCDVGGCRPHVAPDMVLSKMKLSSAACSSTFLFLFKSYVTTKIPLTQRLLGRNIDYLGFSRWAFFREGPQYLKNLPQKKVGEEK